MGTVSVILHKRRGEYFDINLVIRILVDIKVKAAYGREYTLAAFF